MSTQGTNRFEMFTQILAEPAQAARQVSERLGVEGRSFQGLVEELLGRCLKVA